MKGTANLSKKLSLARFRIFRPSSTSGSSIKVIPIPGLDLSGTSLSKKLVMADRDSQYPVALVLIVVSKILDTCRFRFLYRYLVKIVIYIDKE